MVPKQLLLVNFGLRVVLVAAMLPAIARAQQLSDFSTMARDVVHQPFDDRGGQLSAFGKYLRMTPASKIELQQEALRKKYGVDSAESAGCMCLMALSGFHVNDNLRDLWHLSRMHSFSQGDQWSVDLREAMPCLFADIAARQGSVLAARYLVLLGHRFPTETQSYVVFETFKRIPDLVVSAASGRPSIERSFLRQLAEGASDGAGGVEAIRAIAKAHVPGSTGIQRRLLRKIGERKWPNYYLRLRRL